jgi:hypothetical protein
MVIYHPAATAAALGVLSKRLQGHIREEIADFERQRTTALERDRLRELELNRRRVETGELYAELKPAGSKLPAIDWTRQIVEWNPQTPPRTLGFGLGALICRTFPWVCKFGGDLMLFEIATVLGLPESESEAHCERAVTGISTLILPEIPKQKIDSKAWRLQPESALSGPFEEVLDRDHHVVQRQRAFYAEPQGILEKLLQELLSDDTWGILRRPKLRRLLSGKIKQTLRSRAVLVDDRRTRLQMVDECKQRHGIVDKEIYTAVGVRSEDFYRWRKDGCSNRTLIHRRLVWALFSPTWPPPPPPE